MRYVWIYSILLLGFSDKFLQQGNTPSDIWSLGAVFLEMTTVLAGRTLADMKAFYSEHGSNGSYIRTNPEATKLWMTELERQPDCEHDTQLLNLIAQMTERKPDDRPTAQQVVITIQDFDCLQPYCGDCCYIDDGNTATSYAGSVSSILDKDDSSEHSPDVSTADTSKSLLEAKSESAWQSTTRREPTEDDTVMVQSTSLVEVDSSSNPTNDSQHHYAPQSPVHNRQDSKQTRQQHDSLAESDAVGFLALRNRYA